MVTNDYQFTYSTKIEDNKLEKIAIVVDMYEEIYKEDFLSLTNEAKLLRFNVIFDEIQTFIKLKDYFSDKIEFALYTYQDKLKKEIEFLPFRDFMAQFSEFKNRLRGDNVVSGDYLDLAEIYSEAFTYLNKFTSIKTFENSHNSGNDIIIRFILFYNRSEIPAVISNTKDFNLINFVRLTNFFFDVIFIRKKIANDDDKRTLTEVFNSLTIVKPKFWYAFENSGNLAKLKFILNLLLANPNQRIKLSEIDKHQKKIDELVKNYSDT